MSKEAKDYDAYLHNFWNTKIQSDIQNKVPIVDLYPPKPPLSQRTIERREERAERLGVWACDSFDSDASVSETKVCTDKFARARM